jgi:hypothetical protein
MDLIYFLGRFHVLALHLPIGMLFVVVLTQGLASTQRYAYVRAFIPALWAATAGAALLTVVLGLMHFSEGSFDGVAGQRHRGYGVAFALFTVLAWLLSALQPRLYQRALALPACVVALFLVTMTGHYGGNLTHGATYLVEYAPQPLRALAGLAPTRPAVTSLETADVYLDLVGPLLQARCSNCHNGDKRSGGLDVTSHANLLRGGEAGPVLVAGNADASELQRRISLRRDHDDFMPAEGKTPLSEPQVAILRWWIDAGAPAGGALAGMDLADLRPALQAQLGLDGGAAIAAASPAVDQALVTRLYEAGFVVRQLSQDDPLLDVAVYSPGTEIAQEALAELVMAREHIGSLDLRRAGIDDVDLELLRISDFTNLHNLLLSNNLVSDQGVRSLAGARQLQHLNLYGNPLVTSASLDALGGLSQLQSLYLWQTGIDAGAVATLRAKLPATRIDAGGKTGAAQ